MTVSHTSSPRTALVCGPYLSGKTSLFEALLAEAGALKKHASNGSFSLGDSSPEAREHGMSTEMNIASVDYLGEPWTFIDCPGSIELMHETRCAMTVADIAVVVVEPDKEKSVILGAYLKLLDELSVPHIVFINKLDKKNLSVSALLEAFQTVSDKPLVLREVPIHEGDVITGHVDLVSERAFHWEENKPSSLISLPKDLKEHEADVRTQLFENLADFDDTLLEKLLENVEPSNEEIYENLAKDLSTNLVVPVFFGSAANGNGIHRLMKALRHEAPDVTVTAERLGIECDGGTKVKIFKTIHAGHAGKVSLGRVMCGSMGDGDTLNRERPSGMNQLFGSKMTLIHTVDTGGIAGFTKLDNTDTGDLVTNDGKEENDGLSDPPTPLYALAIKTENHGDDVKLSDTLKKVLEEDPSLSVDLSPLTGEQVLHGQGDMHLKLALEKLKNRSGLGVAAAPPTVAYRETARKKVEKRVRHKKQSGGHGEFGEVNIVMAPRARGEGFQFNDEIHGGVVPRNYIPAVQAGVEDAMNKGPLGFPVVDVEVTLNDGKFHSVDSSEFAFRKAGSQAMREALADSSPILLEPINNVTILIPDSFIAPVQKIILGHRGQILGFDAKPGWDGWDEIVCLLPASGMQNLIMEIRSVTMGVGTFETKFDHLQELSGREADMITAARAEAE